MQPEPITITVALIPLIVLVGLLVLLVLWVFRLSKLQELKQRQVLAMIEKGMVPPPELMPVNADAALPARRATSAARFSTGGIIVVGLGAAVGLIVGVAAGQARAGLGIGTGIIAIGVAMIVAGVFTRALPAERATLIDGQPAPSSRAGDDLHTS